MASRPKKKSPNRRDKRAQRVDKPVKSEATSDVSPKGPIHIRSEAQLKRLLEQPEPVLIDFWAPWCGPCRMMAPIFEQVARELDGAVRFVKINTEEVPEVGRALGVRSIPTLVALQGSEVIDTHVGLMPASSLMRMARRLDDLARGVTLGDKMKRWLGIGAAPVS